MTQRRTILILAALLLIAACSAPFQGIRFRVQAPAIDDGFRKISLAIQTDGYTVEQLDLKKYMILSGTRDLKPEELSDGDRHLPPGSVQGRIRVRFEPRGRLYEVYITPLLRYRVGESWTERPADVRHPLWTRWQTLLTRLLEREVPDGD